MIDIHTEAGSYWLLTLSLTPGVFKCYPINTLKNMWITKSAITGKQIRLTTFPQFICRPNGITVSFWRCFCASRLMFSLQNNCLCYLIDLEEKDQHESDMSDNY